jgi:nucleotide-binding universal stress UspA family protein
MAEAAIAVVEDGASAGAGDQGRPTVFERIVVGLDGSDISETALQTAVELAERLRVPLHLVRIADLAVVHWGSSEAAEEYARLSTAMSREKEAATRYLEAIAQPLRERGLEVTTEVRSGAAAKELENAVTPRDLLVVASHGRHGLERLLIGSVAEQVARRCPAPVLIARR